MSDQFLADINTPFFMEAENDYEMDCDYIEFTPENLLKIHEDILSLEADREAAQRLTDMRRSLVQTAHGYSEKRKIWQKMIPELRV